VKRAAVAEPIRVRRQRDCVVDTGKIRLVIDRKKGTIIREISLDGKPVIAGESGGVYLQNQDRTIFRSAWDQEAPEITIEERGPIEAVIRQAAGIRQMMASVYAVMMFGFMPLPASHI